MLGILSLIIIQIQYFFTQCHLCLLLGVEYILECAFGNYLVIFSITLTKPLAAIVILFIYIFIIVMIIAGFRNLILWAMYYLLIHAYNKSYSGVMMLLSFPKFIIVTGVSLTIYGLICFFVSAILIDYNFSQLVFFQETELRIVEQFYWFSLELAEHNHFREKFLVSGLCELDQQIINYLIRQAEIHNSTCHSNSKDDFVELSEMRADILCKHIQYRTGYALDLDYSEAAQYADAAETCQKREKRHWLVTAAISNLQNFLKLLQKIKKPN